MVIFHSYVSLPEGTSQGSLELIWLWVNTYRYITIVGWRSILTQLWLGVNTRYQGFDTSPYSPVTGNNNFKTHSICYDFIYWLVVYLPTPMKNDGFRQLRSWHSQLNGQIKAMFQTTNQLSISSPRSKVCFWRVMQTCQGGTNGSTQITYRFQQTNGGSVSGKTRDVTQQHGFFLANNMSRSWLTPGWVLIKLL